MTHSLMKRVVMCAEIVALSISLVGQPAMAKGKKLAEVTVKCGDGESIADRIAMHKRKQKPLVVKIDGICTSGFLGEFTSI